MHFSDYDPLLAVDAENYFSATIQSAVFWIAYVGLHVGLFAFGWIKQRDDPELEVLNRLGTSVYMSRAAGLVLSLDLTLLILPTCRNMIRLIRSPLINRWIPFDENIFLHKVTAFSMMLFTTIHVNAHYTNFFLVPQVLPQLNLKTWELHYKTWAGLTGHAMVIILFLIGTCSVPLVRKKMFEIFFLKNSYSHHLFYLFYLLLFFHSFGCFVKSSINGTCKGYNSNIFTIPVFLIGIIDRLVRISRSREDTHISNVIIHPAKVVELRIEKPTMQYIPGQYLYVNIPQISKFEWHPFTITSSPQEGFISLHIKVVGDWTESLLKQVLSKVPKILIDGPYGAPAQDIFNYEISVLISAGIGCTPASGILKSVHYACRRNAPMKLQKLFFIWICRDLQDLAWFKSELLKIERESSFIHSTIYITGNIPISNIKEIVMEENPESELRHCTFYGRPKWPKIFQSLKTSVKSKTEGTTEVGVFFCGPPLLKSVLSNEIKQCSTYEIQFILRSEQF